MTDTPDELTEPTEAQLAIHGKLVGRFRGFSFKTTPPVEVDGVVVCDLMAQRRPKDEWYKLKTVFPVETTEVEAEQLLRLIERELMHLGAQDREPDGAPQYPQMGRRY